MPNPVVHWEVHTKEAKKCREFLANVFDRHVDSSNPMDYGFIDTHAGGINGGISPSEEPNKTLVYVEVDDLQGYLDKNESLGGETVVPITEIPNVVTFAHFTDPVGNLMGLVKSDGI